MSIKEKIQASIKQILAQMGESDEDFSVALPELEMGDYSTNIALKLASKLGQNPKEVAEKIAAELGDKLSEDVERIEVAGPGFINFWIRKEGLVASFTSDKKENGYEGKKIMVEYAHPNTHKEMHIGHLRTLVTGEAIARLLKASGAQVFRANYQGDIGPHVAKALYGVEKLLAEQNLSLDDVEKWTAVAKAKLLGDAYVKGNQDYEAQKDEIDGINNKLYQKDPSIWPLYETTRVWSLEYYEEFYKRFYTNFDKLFFESEMVQAGKKIVEENVGKVFARDNGAIIFPGEEYGLHTRVFVTQAGNPTYEGKEMGNGFAEWNAFNFDRKIHVVGSEQAGYFQVVFKALELIDPAKFKDKQQHVSMGMVSVVGMKMSSRTGEILRVDELIEKVKSQIQGMVEEGRIKAEDKDAVTEMVAIGAIKYSVLKVGTGQNVAFDVEKSVSLEGDSGPYLQYTFARTQSVISKSQKDWKLEIGHWPLEIEESDLLRFAYRFGDVSSEAAESLSPNHLCEYLYDLARLYNVFYQKHKIIGSEKEGSRLALTQLTAAVLKEGLDLLGIKAPERM